MDDITNWLMDGDPVIRWQTMRDLLDCKEEHWQAERRRMIQTGWGAQFLAAMLPNCTWPDGRWTSTVWTLLVMMDCGIPNDEPLVRQAVLKFLDHNLSLKRSTDDEYLLGRVDLCHLGFWLRIGAYFLGKDERLSNLSERILRVQLADGGWNCRIRNYPKTTHSSFNTTFNILEGLRPAALAGIVEHDVYRRAEAQALEFMLQHKMYRSDKTGEIVDHRFPHLTFPSGWHYNILRGLDYMRSCPEIHDSRLNDPITLLESRRNSNGRWPTEKRIPGETHFDMEKFGGESRWNTLRMLRVLKCRDHD